LGPQTGADLGLVHKWR